MGMFRLGALGLLALLLLSGAANGAATSSTGSVVRFAPSAKASAAALPADARPGSGRIGQLPAAWLAQPRIQITLPDGTTVTATQRQVSRGANSTSWFGKVAGASDGMLALTAAQGRVTGVLTYGTATYEFRPQGRDVAVMYEIDPASRSRGLSQPIVVNYKSRDGATSAKTSTLAPLAPKPAPVVLQTVVMYTGASLTHMGDFAEENVRNAIQIANGTYESSGVDAMLDLVAVLPTALNEGSGGMYETLTAFSDRPDVQSIREQYAADLVLLVSADTDFCGMAYLMQRPDTGFAPWAYGVISSRCITGTTLAHEAGHMLGLLHDRETERASGDGAQPSRPYAYGYRVCVQSPAAPGPSDIMSYPCETGRSSGFQQFSNPRKMLLGWPFGVDYETDPENAADAVRALNDNAPVAMNFRQSRDSMPGVPLNIAAQKLSLTLVQLTWSDSTGPESGFVVERAVDNGEWDRIALIRGNVLLHNDSVEMERTYSYRVRAYNGTGMSEPTGTVVVSTKLEPPLAPAGLRVTDNGDRSVTIQWNPVLDSNATFEVQRETWAKVRVTTQVGSKTKTRKMMQYAYPTRVGTLPAGGISMIDMCGKGQFRYTVRAINAAGVGPYATPVTITVRKK